MELREQGVSKGSKWNSEQNRPRGTRPLFHFAAKASSSAVTVVNAQRSNFKIEECREATVFCCGYTDGAAGFAPTSKYRRND